MGVPGKLPSLRISNAEDEVSFLRTGTHDSPGRDEPEEVENDPPEVFSSFARELASSGFPGRTGVEKSGSPEG